MEQRDAKGLTEREFLAAYAKKNYPRPYVTADLVLFSEDGTEVLLVRRKGHPCIGRWAFPGGFANADESVSQTALRELAEETGISTLTESDIREVGLFSKPGRDPRGWVVSEAYTARVPKESVSPKAGDDAAQAGWFAIGMDGDRAVSLSGEGEVLPVEALAFDHAEMLQRALRLYGRVL